MYYDDRLKVIRRSIETALKVFGQITISEYVTSRFFKRTAYYLISD